MLDPVAQPLMMPTCSVSIGRLTFLLCPLTKLIVSHGSCVLCAISTLMPGSVLVCRATFCLATTCCMVSTVLLVSSRRNAMFCLATSFYQTTARSLFVRRSQSPDDVMWRRAATWQMRVASATCEALNSTDPLDSGNSQTHEWLLPFQTQEQHRSRTCKLQNNLTAPTVHTSMCSDIFGNNRRMP